MTITSNVQIATLPAASTAVYVTTLVPAGMGSCGSAVELKTTTATLSVTVGAIQKGLAVEEPSFMMATVVMGQPDRTGSSMSEWERDNPCNEDPDHSG